MSAALSATRSGSARIVNRRSVQERCMRVFILGLFIASFGCGGSSDPVPADTGATEGIAEAARRLKVWKRP